MTVFKKRNNFITIILTVAITVLIGGCHIEKRLAYKFVDNSRQVSILILEPDIFLKTNLKVSENELKDIVPEQKDSFSLAQSDFLKNLDLLWARNIFMQELQQELKAYGVNVFFSERIDTFFTLSPPAYLFNIAQVEIEEFYMPFKQEYERSHYDTVTFVQEFLLNALNFNTWFEFSELNSDKKKEVLFSNFYISDEINGNFHVLPRHQKVQYRYYRYDVEDEDIEKLIRYAGRTNARYIYNHILNRHIENNAQYPVPSSKFFHFNRKNNKVYILDNYREFQRIE